ncbi:MAG TPA: hypothetical protein VGG99_19720 [Acetobacteraceae bacterium]|jgi:hypothetical protein
MVRAAACRLRLATYLTLLLPAARSLDGFVSFDSTLARTARKVGAPVVAGP